MVVLYWINPGRKENTDSEYGSRQIAYNDGSTAQEINMLLYTLG